MNEFEYLPNITHEQVNALPVRNFTGNILLIEKPEQIRSIRNALDHNTCFGFDTETRPSFKKGRSHKVSLLQLATSDQAFLFRLNKTGLPEQLIEILQDEKILKIGIALKDDVKALQKLRSFEPKGFIDLQQFVKSFSILDNGLRKLTANILGFKISKRQQTSNWEREILDNDQILYAATDAWVCHEIYKKLQNQLLK